MFGTAFIQQTPCSSIYHTPEMFEVFSRTHGHTPELWAVLNENGNVLALFPPVQIALMHRWLRDFTTRSVSMCESFEHTGCQRARCR